MKTIALKGESRTDLGKSATKAVRAAGQVPCVLYGNGENTHFSIYESDFKNLVYTPNTFLVRLDVDGKQVIAKLQDIQFHPVSEAILHADFYELDLSQPVTIRVPINVVGVAPGVLAGGKLQVKMRKLLVKGLVTDLPESIDVSISKLQIGKSARVRDLSIPNVELLDTPENSIVSVVVTRAARSAAMGASVEEDTADEETTEETAAAEE